MGKVNKYIGMRYIPKHDGEWSATKAYEPLIIVQYQGASYTSKTYVPAGIAVTNTVYWALTGNYIAQMQEYLSRLNELDTSVTQRINDLSALVTSNASNAALFDGMEYLTYYHNKLRLNQKPKIVYSGDSTTYGTNISNTDYKIDALTKAFLFNNGFLSDVVNRGQESKNTADWLASYITQDLALLPDLYILRWGVNDGSVPPIENRLNTYLTNLRNGLATIRASKTVNDLSIIIMTPNSTDDDTNNRNAEWYEEIIPHLRTIAREYQCTFLDTYNYMKDCTNVLWTDSYAIGHIHPLETANMKFISLMAESLVPSFLRNRTSTFTLGLSNSWVIESGYPTTFNKTGKHVQINTSLKSGTSTALVSNGANYTASLIGVIPDGYRPTSNITKIVGCHKADHSILNCMIQIQTSGSIFQITAGDNNQMIFDVDYDIV